MTAATSTWDPEQYARFQAERSKPFYDLAALVETKPGMRVVDLGCGDGVLTAWLHQHLSAMETLGVDNSETILASASKQDATGLRFERSDIETFTASGHSTWYTRTRRCTGYPTMRSCCHDCARCSRPAGRSRYKSQRWMSICLIRRRTAWQSRSHSPAHLATLCAGSTPYYDRPATRNCCGRAVVSSKQSNSTSILTCCRATRQWWSGCAAPISRRTRRGSGRCCSNHFSRSTHGAWLWPSHNDRTCMPMRVS